MANREEELAEKKGSKKAKELPHEGGRDEGSRVVKAAKMVHGGHHVPGESPQGRKSSRGAGEVRGADDAGEGFSVVPSTPQPSTNTRVHREQGRGEGEARSPFWVGRPRHHYSRLRN